MLLVSVALLVVCHGDHPSEPLACQPEFAGTWRWSIGSACGAFNSGVSTAHLSTAQRAITADVASPEQQRSGVHVMLVADFSVPAATLTKTGTSCDTVDHGTISKVGSRYVVSLIAPVKTNCCAGEYVVELTQ
jgi:hypothetical protein